MKPTFKALAITLVNLVLLHFTSSSTVHTVTVANFQFSPANIPNVVVGDVIKWVWESGGHTTTCEPATQGAGNSLPAGAATWNSPINITTTSFEYTVTVAGVYNYWCIPHNPDMAGSFTATGSLPVKLSEFKIANENNDAVLKWLTLSEENTDYFSIQKSKTGSDYVEVAKVPAAGNSSTARSYSYTDPASALQDKFSYYMVAVVYKDGQKELSPVQLFRNNAGVAKLIISISPNPVSRSGHLMLKFNAEKAGKMDVNVVNIEGRFLLKTTMQATEGVNNGHLMLDQLPPGSYSMIFTLNGIKEVHKLTIN